MRRREERKLVVRSKKAAEESGDLGVGSINKGTAEGVLTWNEFPDSLRLRRSDHVVSIRAAQEIAKRVLPHVNGSSQMALACDDLTYLPTVGRTRQRGQFERLPFHLRLGGLCPAEERCLEPLGLADQKQPWYSLEAAVGRTLNPDQPSSLDIPRTQ